MKRFDASAGECRLYVRRAGLLGAIGHDLELRVGEFQIEVDEAALTARARFNAASLRVVDAVEGRTPRPGALSAGDKQQIERNLREDVLEVANHPWIEFQSSSIEPRAGGYAVSGRLSLHGQQRDLSFELRRDGDTLTGETLVHQPDFGIRPFRALGGALRVQPDVTVVFSLSDPKRG